MDKQEKKRKPVVLILLIILVIVLFILVLAYQGYIDLSVFGITFNNSLTNNNNSSGYPGTCPMNSCQAGPGNSCCYATEADRVSGTRSVAAVLVHDSCNCPTDTHYSGVTDIHSEGGPWKICDCN